MVNKKVSAIITTHNRAPIIVQRAVNSVIKQTYETIELIVVDDSSLYFPLRADVEKEIRSISDKIIYIKNDSVQGPCVSRNIGLSYAKGDYIAFLDDDDEWAPNKIEEQIKEFCDNDTMVVYCATIVIDEVLNKKYLSKTESKKSGYIFDALLKENIIGSTSNPLIRKSCIEEVGGFDALMQSSQDYDLWLRITKIHPVKYIDKSLLYYHVHEGESISSNSKKQIQGIERINLKYSEYIDHDKDIWFLRHRILLPYYLREYGRKKAFMLLLECIKNKPTKVKDNITHAILIIIGNDLYNKICEMKENARKYQA